MGVLMGGILQQVVKFAVFLLIAFAGIVCGKKFKDHKDAKQAKIAAAEKETN